MATVHGWVRTSGAPPAELPAQPHTASGHCETFAENIPENRVFAATCEVGFGELQGTHVVADPATYFFDQTIDLRGPHLVGHVVGPHQQQILSLIHISEPTRPY